MTNEIIDKMILTARTEKNNNSVYVWGGSGERVKYMSVYDIQTMEDTPANAGRVLRHIGDLISSGKSIEKARAFDCSGLIIECLKKAGVVGHDYDTTADGLKRKCKETFPVDKAKKGDLVFITNSSGNATHVGLCSTNNYVIEARGRDYGVISRLRNEGKWTIAGRL